MNNNTSDQSDTMNDDIISRPIYMSLMETLEGKPVGYPIWNTFDDQPNVRTLNNETLSSTFISLTKTLSNIESEIPSKGQVMQVNLNNTTYSIYSPSPEDDFQIAFVVVFEEKDSTLISKGLREKLARRLVKSLRNCKSLRIHLKNSSNRQIMPGSNVHAEMDELINKSLLKWSSSLD